MSDSNAKEEKKRRKMLKKMRKILLEAWNHPGSEPFQSGAGDANLKNLGQSVEEEKYYIATNHRQGWEEFARDMGIVYNYHIVKYVLSRFGVVVVQNDMVLFLYSILFVI